MNIIKQFRLRLIPRSSQSQRRRFTRSKAGNVFYFSVLILAGLFTLLPLIYCVATSFKPLDELMIFPPKFFVTRPTTINYTVLPSLLSSLSVPLSRYIFNSVFTSVATTVVYIFISAMMAFVLSKSKLKGRTIIFLVIQFSLLYNAYTLEVPRYLILAKTNTIDSYWVYILPYLPSAMGVFLLKQHMDGSVPDTMIEAAKIDGAGYFRIFAKLALPLSKPAWLTLVLFAFRDLWSMQPSGTVFSENIKTLPMVMTQIISGGIARSGSAMAATVILMIPPIIVYLVAQGSIMETMSSAGIKG